MSGRRREKERDAVNLTSFKSPSSEACDGKNFSKLLNAIKRYRERGLMVGNNRKKGQPHIMYNGRGTAEQWATSEQGDLTFLSLPERFLLDLGPSKSPQTAATPTRGPTDEKQSSPSMYCSSSARKPRKPRKIAYLRLLTKTKDISATESPTTAGSRIPRLDESRLTNDRKSRRLS